MDAHDAPGEKVGVARLVYPDLPDHLPYDDLDVFICYVNALESVDPLHLGNEIVLNRSDSLDSQEVVGVYGAFGQRFAGFNHLAIVNFDESAVRHHRDRLVSFRRRYPDLALSVSFRDLHHT
jgi:hypothetical protein